MKLLIAVHRPYFEQFVGESLLAEIRPLFDRVDLIEPNDIPADRWPEVVAELKPDAMMSCWGTRAVPSGALPKLRYVAHLCGGIRQLVTREMLERGLWVTNWGQIHAAPVAECALLLVLCTLRQTTRWTLDLHRDHRWPHEALHQAHSLIGRRVGIHGFGAVARHLLEFLKPFGCQVSAYSAGVPEALFLQHGVRQAPSLESLFADSDVLVEAEALTPETRHSVTEAHLRRLPRGASFVNVGRGAVVDEAALIRIAQEGWLQIGLDVFETEPPPPDSPLLALPNVTLSPHIGGPTVDLRRQSGRMALANLKRFVQGRQPEATITPEVYDRST